MLKVLMILALLAPAVAAMEDEYDPRDDPKLVPASKFARNSDGTFVLDLKGRPFALSHTPGVKCDLAHKNNINTGDARGCIFYDLSEKTAPDYGKVLRRCDADRDNEWVDEWGGKIYVGFVLLVAGLVAMVGLTLCSKGYTSEGTMALILAFAFVVIGILAPIWIGLFLCGGAALGSKGKGGSND